MPRISPERAVNETSSSTLTPSWLTAERCSTTNLSSTSCGVALSMLRSTFFPTIISVSCFSLVSLVSTVAICSPLRSTATLSLISITSLSLCVMMMIDLPSSLILRMTENSFVISCGVRTAVGSSRMRISAFLYKTFMISTVCFSLTDMSYIFLFKSISNPYLSAIFCNSFARSFLSQLNCALLANLVQGRSEIRLLSSLSVILLGAVRYARTPSCSSFSYSSHSALFASASSMICCFSSLKGNFSSFSPRMILSAAENTSTSLKCWCTIPIWLSKASFGERMTTSSPFTKI